MKTLKIADLDTSNHSYDPITGLITHTRLGRTYTEANNTGYIRIGLQHKITRKPTNVLAHRLAWYLHTGDEPEIIDHLNHNRIDNRISNLVSGTTKTNNQNRPRQKHARILPCITKLPSGNFQAQVISIKTGLRAGVGTYTSDLDAHYVATYYRSIHYSGYQGSDINYIPNHPYFTGTLPSIVATIVDHKGVSALKFMHK